MAKIFGMAFILFLLLLKGAGSAWAAGGPGPERTETVEEKRTAHIWVIGAWNFELCRILADDLETVPQEKDIKYYCGQDAIDMMDSGAAYFYYLGPYEYTVQVKKNLPQIFIISDFQNDHIKVYARDPLPGQTITRIEATINGVPAVCDDYTGARPLDGGLSCSFPAYNAPVDFTAYATSTYGDNSKTIQLRIGNMTTGTSDFQTDKKIRYVVGDNAYTQYNTSMDIFLLWDVYPFIADLPWAARTVPVVDLYTTHYYYYLSGQLLLGGLSDGQNCYNGGTIGQYANQCGLLAAFDQAEQYQNAYNLDISVAAAQVGVPNVLVKRVIAVESQFWPDAYGLHGENGLYQFTRDGVDTLLRWSAAAYLEVCEIYLDDCADLGYDNRSAWEKDIMINHILNDYNNVYWLARALKANAYQVDRLLDNVAGIENAGEYFNYVDLWKITTGNYHTGPTITTAALDQIGQLGQDYTWGNYAMALDRLQPTALQYINRVFYNK